MKVSEEIRSSFDALARKWHVSIHAGIPGGERYTLALYLDRKSLSSELISSEAQMMIKRQKWKGIPVDDDNLLLFFSPWRERDRQVNEITQTLCLNKRCKQRRLTVRLTVIEFKVVQTHERLKSVSRIALSRLLNALILRDWFFLSRNERQQLFMDILERVDSPWIQWFVFNLLFADLLLLEASVRQETNVETISKSVPFSPFGLSFH